MIWQALYMTFLRPGYVDKMVKGYGCFWDAKQVMC